MTLSILLLRSSDSRPIFWCILGFLVGLYIFFQGFRLLQRRHLILNTPVSKIRSASLGMVELNGLAVGPYTMVAPITERPCYYYRSVAWEWKRQGRSSQWVKVAAECMHVPFFLDDNTGKVMVDPRGADLDLHRDFHEEFCDSLFTMKEEAPGNVRRFLSRHGVSTTNKIKVEEFCIKPKNALFLLGTLDENPGQEVTPQPIQDDEVISLTNGSGFSFSLSGAGIAQTALSFAAAGVNGFRGTSFSESESPAPAQVIHLSPAAAPTKAADMSQQQKVAAALLKAGISSPVAWAAAGVTPAALAINSDPHGLSDGGMRSGAGNLSQPISATDAFDPHPPVVMMKGKNNPTFLISWRSQRDLARSLGWKCTLMIWGGPALCLLCLYGLQALTHWF
ncbi:MAG: GIDE domain-containing protein [Candidatus Sulfotelmatobacter sp.]